MYWICPNCGAATYNTDSYCSEECKAADNTPEKIAERAEEKRKRDEEWEAERQKQLRYKEWWNSVSKTAIRFPKHKIEQCFGNHYCQGLFITSTFDFEGEEVKFYHSLTVENHHHDSDEDSYVNAPLPSPHGLNNWNYSCFITVYATNRDYVRWARDYESLMDFVTSNLPKDVIVHFVDEDIPTENDEEYQ